MESFSNVLIIYKQINLIFMKTKNLLFVGAVSLLGVGALSNLQWSMDGYGLLSNPLSKKVLALTPDETDTGTEKKGFKEKKFSGYSRKTTITTTTTTKVDINLGFIDYEKEKKEEVKTEKLEFLNACMGEGDLINCVPSWDEFPMM